MKNIKRISAMVLCALTIISSNSSIFASEVISVEEKPNYTVTRYNDNGVIVDVVTSEEDNIDKKQIDLEMRGGEAFRESNPNEKKLSGDYYFGIKGQASSNTYSEVRGNGYIRATTMSPFDIRVWGGQTKGHYWGNASTPSKMVLREKITYDGLAISISWPPGFSGTSNSREWVSSDYNNTFNATAYREQSSAKSLLSTFSVTVQDGADVYINNVCHKARASVKKGVWDWV